MCLPGFAYLRELIALRFQPADKGFLVLPRRDFQAVAYHMDDVHLDIGLRINAACRTR